MGSAVSATAAAVATPKQPLRSHALYETLLSQRLQHIGDECLAQFQAGEPFVGFPLSFCNVPNPDHVIYEDEPIPFSTLAAHLTSVLPCAFTISVSPYYYGNTLMTSQSWVCVSFVLGGADGRERMM
jgi:hypothetical protein